jgi:hypothetical protein
MLCRLRRLQILNLQKPGLDIKVGWSQKPLDKFYIRPKLDLSYPI